MVWWRGTDKQSKKQGKVAEEVTHVIRNLVKIYYKNNKHNFIQPNSKYKDRQTKKTQNHKLHNAKRTTSQTIIQFMLNVSSVEL